eukprot:6413406-Prymnesium_polylepis.1
MWGWGAGALDCPFVYSVSIELRNIPSAGRLVDVVDRWCLSISKSPCELCVCVLPLMRCDCGTVCVSVAGRLAIFVSCVPAAAPGPPRPVGLGAGEGGIHLRKSD